MKSVDEMNHSLAAIEADLAELNSHRSELLAQAAELQREKASLLQPIALPGSSESQPTVTNQSSQEEKIALFRRLFRGREDVYFRRFESVKTGKKGYLRSSTQSQTLLAVHKIVRSSSIRSLSFWRLYE